MRRKKIIYTQPTIEKNGYKFIRVELNRDVEHYIVDKLGFKVQLSGASDCLEYELFNNEKELIMFNSIDIGWQDYRATYGEGLFNGGWRDAIYIREDYLYLKDTELPPKKEYPKGSAMYYIEKYLGEAFDNQFKKESKK